MRYLSVCSGIEAVTVAWQPLGFTPVAYAEIDAFPSAVLRYHYPQVPNWGDLTQWKDWPDATVDVLVGGTPCQSFSVAGLRTGLADPRGNLALVYLALLDRYRPQWCLWENVPGVLSSNGGRDFGAFLGGLAELGYGWAYRILDAQFFGLAQRRRRVFVVGCARGWPRAAAVLFDAQSLSGHPPPRRETGQDVTGPIAGCSNGGGANGPGRTADDADSLIPDVVGTLSDGAHHGGGLNGQDAYSGRIFPVAHALRADGFDASEDGTGRGTPPLVPLAIRTAQTSANGHGLATNCAHTLDGAQGQAVAFDARQSDVLHYGDQSGPLDTDGHSIGIAFSVKDYGGDAGPLAPTLRAGWHASSHANGGVMPAIQQGLAVRRLTPRECERLQGFPDDYTLIPYRGTPAKDGPRYKALGNSMAVPVIHWLGTRLLAVHALPD